MSNPFLFSALLFPRPTLLLAWLFGIMPANGTPFLVDLLGAIFAPRFLIAWWLYEAQAHPFLIGLFVVFGILEFVVGSLAMVFYIIGMIGASCWWARR